MKVEGLGFYNANEEEDRLLYGYRLLSLRHTLDFASVDTSSEAGAPHHIAAN